MTRIELANESHSVQHTKQFRTELHFAEIKIAQHLFKNSLVFLCTTETSNAMQYKTKSYNDHSAFVFTNLYHIQGVA